MRFALPDAQNRENERPECDRGPFGSCSAFCVCPPRRLAVGAPPIGTRCLLCSRILPLVTTGASLRAREPQEDMRARWYSPDRPTRGENPS